jgi:N-acetylmuramic acid 6-phosphate (MurNAc-6-P) etherase
MQVTMEIPDELAAELIAAGKVPLRTALEAAEDAARKGIRQRLEDGSRRRTPGC